MLILDANKHLTLDFFDRHFPTQLELAALTSFYKGIGAELATWFIPQTHLLIALENKRQAVTHPVAKFLRLGTWLKKSNTPLTQAHQLTNDLEAQIHCRLKEARLNLQYTMRASNLRLGSDRRHHSVELRNLHLHHVNHELDDFCRHLSQARFMETMESSNDLLKNLLQSRHFTL